MYFIQRWWCRISFQLHSIVYWKPWRLISQVESCLVWLLLGWSENLHLHLLFLNKVRHTWSRAVYSISDTASIIFLVQYLWYTDHKEVKVKSHHYNSFIFNCPRHHMNGSVVQGSASLLPWKWNHFLLILQWIIFGCCGIRWIRKIQSIHNCVKKRGSVLVPIQLISDTATRQVITQSETSPRVCVHWG